MIQPILSFSDNKNNLKTNRNVSFKNIREGHMNKKVRNLMTQSIVFGDFAKDKMAGQSFVKEIDKAVNKYSNNDDVYKYLRGYFVKNVGEDVSVLNDENKRIATRISGVHMALSSFLPTKYTDIGCGNGKITEGIAKSYAIKKNDTNGFDVFLYPDKDIDITLKKYDGVNIPLKNNSQDCVSFFTVFHHIKNPKSLFENIKNILTKDGKLLIREFNAESLDDKNFNLVMDEMLYKVYNDYSQVPISKSYVGKVELKSILSKFGFKCEKIIDDTGSDTLISKNPYKPFYAVFSPID